MTWARVKQTGAGRVEFRVSIEGFPHDFVTHAQMEVTQSDGRKRIGGLMRDSLRWTEDVVPAHSDFNGTGPAIKIADRADEEVAVALISKPSKRTSLRVTALHSDTTLEVSDAAPFAIGDYIHVNQEAMRITNITPDAPHDLIEVVRARWGTVARTHWVIGAGTATRLPVVADRPASIEGRRVTVYAYGEGDDPSGDGTPVFRGIASTDAKLGDNGSAWSFQVDHMSTLLKQKCGSDENEPRQPIGIIYQANRPLLIRFTQRNYKTSGGISFLVLERERVMSFYGLFATQATFCTALTSAIGSFLTAAGFVTHHEISAVEDGDSWNLRLVSNTDPNFPADSRGIMCEVLQPTGQEIDPRIEGWTHSNGPAERGVFMAAGLGIMFGKKVGGASGGVPRGSFGGPVPPQPQLSRLWRNSPPASQQAILDGYGVYLDNELDDPSYNALQIEIPLDSGDTRVEHVQVATPVDDEVRLTAPLRPVSYTPENLPRFVYGWQHEGAPVTFSQFLVSQSRAFSNRGAFPFINQGDFSIGFGGPRDEGWLQFQRFPWLAHRVWYQRKSRSLEELFKEEAKQAGVFLATYPEGVITMRSPKFPAATEAVRWVVPSSHVIVSDGFPTWERAAQTGFISTFELKTGYDAAQDKHEGPTILVRDTESAGANTASGTVKAEPVSRPGDGEPSYLEVAEIWGDLLGYYGNDHATVTVDLPLIYHDCMCGDTMRVTSKHIPDPRTGKRGATAAGFIVGREVDIPRGKIRVKLLVSYLDVAGYGPAAHVTASSGSGATWTLTLSKLYAGTGPDMYADGEGVASHFAPGDLVKVYEFGTDPETFYRGTVSTVSPFVVNFTATFPGGAGWVVTFDDSDLIAPRQEQYTFMGSIGDQVVYPSRSEIARRWAP